jgi:hypothetical protein
VETRGEKYCKRTWRIHDYLHAAEDMNDMAPPSTVKYPPSTAMTPLCPGFNGSSQLLVLEPNQNVRECTFVCVIATFLTEYLLITSQLIPETKFIFFCYTIHSGVGPDGAMSADSQGIGPEHI